MLCEPLLLLQFYKFGACSQVKTLLKLPHNRVVYLSCPSLLKRIELQEKMEQVIR